MADDTTASDPWKDILILALDGGGTRGYASLLMLQELMNQIAIIEESGMYMSSDYGGHFEPHHSSFGRSDGDSILVSKSAAAEPISNSQPAVGFHLNRGFSFRQRSTQPQDRIDRLAQRRVATRQALLFERSKYLPCHYFDYIGGTSTGGLAALMLGRLRMSVDECISRYPEMSRSIFGTKKPLSFGGLMKDKYPATNLKNVIEDIVFEHLPEQKQTDECLQMKSPEDLCKTVVVARQDHNRAAHLFRSYNATGSKSGNPHNPGLADTCQIWEAARATSAAPTYFKSITINDDTFYDGGVGYNDPTAQVFKDVLIRENCRHGPASIALVLTLGTGTEPTLKQKVKGIVNTPKAWIKDHKKFKRIRLIYRRLVKDTMTNTAGVEAEMREFADEGGFEYLKWDGGYEVGSLGLDNCKPEAFAKMDMGICKYMEDKSDEIKKAAELLVRKRRARFEDQDRWQRYSYCTLFDCPLGICKLSFGTRAELRRHIEGEHGDRLCDPGAEAGRAAMVMPDLRGPFGHNLGR